MQHYLQSLCMDNGGHRQDHPWYIRSQLIVFIVEVVGVSDHWLFVVALVVDSRVLSVQVEVLGDAEGVCTVQ